MDKISENTQGKNHHLKMSLREGQTMDLESGNIHDSSGVMNDAADAIEELEKEREKDEMLWVLSTLLGIILLVCATLIAVLVDQKIKNNALDEVRVYMCSIVECK